MPAPTCLVTYASTHGHVGRMAEATADRLRRPGLADGAAALVAVPAPA